MASLLYQLRKIGKFLKESNGKNFVPVSYSQTPPGASTFFFPPTFRLSENIFKVFKNI